MVCKCVMLTQMPSIVVITTAVHSSIGSLRHRVYIGGFQSELAGR